MLVVGLTGGIASGKSIVAKMFGDLGARVIDADLVSREVMSTHTECWRKVVKQFGRGILDPDLAINRKKLAQEIFADDEKRALLNRIVHPFITHRIDEMLSHLRSTDPHALVIIDAALLVETGQYRNCDTLVVVAVREEVQLARLMSRDGITGEEALRQVRAQLPLAEKAKVADHVIHNEGTVDETRAQTEQLFRRLHEAPPGAPEGCG